VEKERQILLTCHDFLLYSSFNLSFRDSHLLRTTSLQMDPSLNKTQEELYYIWLNSDRKIRELHFRLNLSLAKVLHFIAKFIESITIYFTCGFLG
jgi:hypothetical protein